MSLSPVQRQCLQALNVPLYTQRISSCDKVLEGGPEGVDTPHQLHEPASFHAAADEGEWLKLEQQVKQCQLCLLSAGRTQTVFGTGNRGASLMFIGEAPGMHEDKQGLPFVGRAGQLLTHMLAALNLTRDEVFIANILKCRPPNNRDPSPEEVATCTPYLQQQVALVQPRLIVALGRISAHYLLGVSTPLNRLRGQTFSYGAASTPLIVTYHPAYLLRNPADKRKALEDLYRIQALLTVK